MISHWMIIGLSVEVGGKKVCTFLFSQNIIIRLKLFHNLNEPILRIRLLFLMTFLQIEERYYKQSVYHAFLQVVSHK